MKNILKKVHAIMSEVDYIQKDKRNDFHNYNYASESAIKSRLHEAFVKHGVVFQFSTNDVSVQSMPMGKGEQVVATVKCSWSLWDTDSGESMSGSAAGVGADNGDKGVYKAITGAIKYALTSNFLIPTGDDPEDDGNSASGKEATYHAPEPMPLDQINQMAPKIHSDNADALCPSCGVGVLREKIGKYGAFISCSLYPKCRHRAS